MFRKLTLMLVMAGAALLSVASADAQILGNQDPSALTLPGTNIPAAPPGYRQSQPRQRYQPPPAQAQRYDRGYDRGDDRGYDRRRGYDYDDGPRYRRGGGGRFSGFCATSRGPCRTSPQPVGSNCRCHVDGLLKRGVIQ
jgi:hypothetical protein